MGRVSGARSRGGGRERGTHLGSQRLDLGGRPGALDERRHGARRGGDDVLGRARAVVACLGGRQSGSARGRRERGRGTHCERGPSRQGRAARRREGQSCARRRRDERVTHLDGRETCESERSARRPRSATGRERRRTLNAFSAAQRLVLVGVAVDVDCVEGRQRRERRENVGGRGGSGGRTDVDDSLQAVCNFVVLRGQAAAMTAPLCVRGRPGTSREVSRRDEAEEVGA